MLSIAATHHCRYTFDEQTLNIAENVLRSLICPKIFPQSSAHASTITYSLRSCTKISVQESIVM